MEWNDMPDVDEIEVSGKKRKTEKTPEEILKEDIYNRRVKLVALSKSDYSKFIQYILDNEIFFKTKMKDADKECMRRTCDRAWTRNTLQSTLDDLRTFDRVFGPLIDERRSNTIHVIRDGVRIDKSEPFKLPIDQQVTWFSDCPYDTFWDWITKEETQQKLAERPDLRFRVELCIDTNRRHNYEFIKKRKRYEESDEIVFKKVLNSMQEVTE